MGYDISDLLHDLSARQKELLQNQTQEAEEELKYIQWVRGFIQDQKHTYDILLRPRYERFQNECGGLSCEDYEDTNW